MSRILGAFHQLSYLSSYAAELFDGLMLLAQDANERIKDISYRSSLLHSNMTTDSFNLDGTGHSGKNAKEKFLKNRYGHNLTVLVRNTNCRQLLSVYQSCNYPPQFWKLDAYSGGKDASLLYSNPGIIIQLNLSFSLSHIQFFKGFFFAEWLKAEHNRQQTARQAHKRQKQLKKLARIERKKKYLSLIRASDEYNDHENDNIINSGDEEEHEPHETFDNVDMDEVDEVDLRSKPANFLHKNKNYSKTIPRKKFDRTKEIIHDELDEVLQFYSVFFSLILFYLTSCELRITMVTKNPSIYHYLQL